MLIAFKLQLLVSSKIGIFQHTNSIQSSNFAYHPTNYLISTFKLQSLVSFKLTSSNAPIPSKAVILHQHHVTNFLLIVHLNSAIMKRLIQPALHHHPQSSKPQKQLSSSFLSFAVAKAAFSKTM
jgi:uncharacterized protein YueI